MSETILKFLLDEMKIVRLKCRNNKCGVVIEMPVNDIDKFIIDCQCPSCRQSFRGPKDLGSPDFLEQLSKAFRGLALTNGVAVEFVLPGQLASQK